MSRDDPLSLPGRAAPRDGAIGKADSGSSLPQRNALQLARPLAFLELVQFDDREPCGEAFDG